jgi:hypothetical protein
MDSKNFVINKLLFRKKLYGMYLCMYVFNISGGVANIYL